MKTITFLLSLVGASLTVTTATASMPNDNEVVTLPAYTVTAARYTDFEKAIAGSLAELRAKAQPAVVVRTELPSLNTVAKQQAATQNERSLAANVPTPRVQARS